MTSPDEPSIERPASRSALTLNNALKINGLYVNGLPLNGLPLNGLPLNGLYVNGLPLNGLYVNGLPVNGLSLNGLPLNGLYVNGLPLNGLYVNGVYPNGLYVNGLPLNGLPLNGLYVNGSTPATALQIADTNGALIDLTPDQELAFESMMGHLVWCALPQGDSTTIYRSDGQAKTYPGYHGLAPTWKTSGLVDDPTGVDASETLRWCVEHYRPVDGSNDVYPGLALSEQQQADLQKLFRYAIECALDPDDTVSIEFPSGSIAFSGALGLAPGWKTGALDVAGQKAVSACLGARTNAHGTTVRISLRGSFTGLATTPVERANFKTHEGAFWGNVFGASPALHASKQDGGGPAGRLCTDGSCGFTMHDTCAGVGGRDTLDGDGNWTSCGSADESIVLNTFLMTESSMASGPSHFCARRVTGEVWCHGGNPWGQLGDGTFADRADPVAVVGLPDAVERQPKQIEAGGGATCTRLRDGTLWCWGNNLFGRLGDGSETSRPAPVQVLAMEDKAASVVMSGSHTCALRMDGTVWCWGYNKYGQLGDGTSTHRMLPVQAGAAELGHDVIQVAAGTSSDHTCALKMDGTVWCWGYNKYGQLGDGTTIDRTSPVRSGPSELGDQVVRIAVGGYHTCALKTDRTLWCWGNDSEGQLGAGSTGSSLVPVRSGASQLGDSVTDVELGEYHSCAVKTDGTLWCWGYNGWGQVGDGTRTSRSSPLSVSLPAPVQTLKLGIYLTTVRLTDGSVWWWGMEPGQVTEFMEPTRFSETPARLSRFLNPSDGVCEFSESTLYEPQDCLICGDGTCSPGEGCETCPDDCAPTLYPDMDGDGYGAAAPTILACSPPNGYVANSSDCDDTSATTYPGSTEVLDGIDNDCDGTVDEGVNLLPNPGFATDTSDWTASGGTLTRETKSCMSNPGCAKLTTTGASVGDTVGASGPGTYTASAWIKNAAKSGSITAYLQIEERTAEGVLVGVSNSVSASAGKTYAELSASRSVTSSGNVVRVKLFMTSGSSMLFDSISLMR